MCIVCACLCVNREKVVAPDMLAATHYRDFFHNIAGVCVCVSVFLPVCLCYLYGRKAPYLPLHGYGQNKN